MSLLEDLVPILHPARALLWDLPPRSELQHGPSRRQFVSGIATSSTGLLRESRRAFRLNTVLDLLLVSALFQRHMQWLRVIQKRWYMQLTINHVTTATWNLQKYIVGGLHTNSCLSGSTGYCYRTMTKRVLQDWIALAIVIDL